MTWRHSLSAFAGRLRARVYRCDSWAPMYQLDGMGKALVREFGERCTLTEGHDGAHSNGETTWT